MQNGFESASTDSLIFTLEIIALSKGKWGRLRVSVPTSSPQNPSGRLDERMTGPRPRGGFSRWPLLRVARLVPSTVRAMPVWLW